MPIFDQGYQHWRGPLSGHFWRWLTIARHGVRVQGKNRFLRILLLVSWLPALLLVVTLALWGLVEQRSESVLGFVRPLLPASVLEEPQAYRLAVWTVAYSWFFKFEMFFVMLLVVIAGPGLISQDLRFNALPLYFARPLTRLDYFLGKLGVIAALVAWVAVGPAVFAYVVGVCFSLDLRVVKDTYPLLLGSAAYGLVITLSVGTLMLALSSLTRRSLYVGITWAGFWIISGSVGGILTGIHGEMVRQEIIHDEMNRWVEENPPPQGAMLSRSSTGPYPSLRVNQKTGKYELNGLRPDQQEEGERWYKAWSEASQQAWQNALAEQAAAGRRDWRPMCSYVANLDRMADLFLDTDGAWVAIGKAVERPRAALGAAFGPRARRGSQGGRQAQVNERFLADQMVPQYPWSWSAGVLAALVGLSTWTLTRRVKSLDRLK